MPIICWGQLAKSADDTTRIEQSIGEYIESHNEDPNAHMGVDYALGAHRLAAELDHLPGSILNKYLYPQARIYKSVVDLAGNGDTDNIQTAITNTSALGGGNILLKSGIYLPGSNIVMASNVKIIGEDIENTIIDFNNAAYGIISSVKDNNGIDGVTVKNSTIEAININQNSYSNYRNINFDNNQYDIKINGDCVQNIIENIHSINNYNKGIIVSNAAYTNQVNWIRNVLIESIGDCGLNVLSGYGNYIERVIVNGAINNGIEINGGSIDYTYLVACEGNNCGMSGIAVYQADRIKLINCSMRGNTGNGMYCENMGDSQIISPQVFDNGGIGIELESTTTSNLIDSYLSKYNSGAAIRDVGTNNIWGSYIS